MKKMTVIFFSLLLSTGIGFSQTVTVDGNVFLEGQTNHENIMILFTRTAPSVLLDTAYTNASGNYSKIVQTGIYNVSCSKLGYQTVTIDDVNLYSNTTLNEITLETGIELSGQLSGVINQGSYIITDDIEIMAGASLTIQPGVTMLFHQDVIFDINGLLIAEGTENDSIRFTRHDNNIYWGGLRFNDNADDNSILSFCTVEYSNNTGVRCFGSSPTIAKSVISNNIGQYGGGFQFDGNSSPLIVNTTIKDNIADDGAGIMSYSSSPIVINSIFGNNTTNNYGSGGAICSHNSIPLVTNSSFINNSATYGGAIYCNGQTSPKMINCIFINNNEYSIYNSSNSSYFPEILYSNSWGNNPENFYNCNDWLGEMVTVNNNGDSIDPYNNIQLDPMFIDVENGDFHLQANSPCIDAGINDSVDINYDFEGNIRIFDGTGNEESIVDMGIYEFVNPTYIENSISQENSETLYEIFPNPNSGLMNIKVNTFETNLLIKIFDINGKVVKSLNIENINKQLHKINLSNYQKGIYFIKFISRNNIKVKKIVVK